MKFDVRICSLARGREEWLKITVDAVDGNAAAAQAIAKGRAERPAARITCHGVKPTPRDDAPFVDADYVPKRGPGRPKKPLDAVVAA